jgi:hypothetical protein
MYNKINRKCLHATWLFVTYWCSDALLASLRVGHWRRKSEWPDWVNFRQLGDCWRWAVFFENYRSSPNFCATFSTVNVLRYCINFDKNCAERHLGQFYHKLIWSPWQTSILYKVLLSHTYIMYVLVNNCVRKTLTGYFWRDKRITIIIGFEF